jgi:multidrug efflux system membrane fusion protein
MLIVSLVKTHALGKSGSSVIASNGPQSTFGTAMNKRWMLVGVIAMLGVAAVGSLYGLKAQAPSGGSGSGARRGQGGPGGGAERAIPVRAAQARPGHMDVVVNAIGTVTARNTAIVRSRVDGLLISVNFREGQLVMAGELLAQIDPRPFQIALEQAQGQLARDQAQLANAQADLERYTGLLKEDSIARQQVDAQAALVRQLDGTLQADRAQLDNARLQLEFTRITAPIGGRLGLRLVDMGNMIHVADPNGLVVITQTQPITVLFSIPSERLGSLLPRWRKGVVLTVQAFDRDGKTKLATGRLVSIDNQIDLATGTVKLRAEFANADGMLFPNQFVNARLKIETLTNATLVPSAAIQRGAPGTYVYVVNDDNTVALRPVVLGPAAEDIVSIERGVKPGDQVVIDGADGLREGAKVEVVSDTAESAVPNRTRGRPKS